jgi:hypothetical protein
VHIDEIPAGAAQDGRLVRMVKGELAFPFLLGFGQFAILGKLFFAYFLNGGADSVGSSELFSVFLSATNGLISRLPIDSTLGNGFLKNHVDSLAGSLNGADDKISSAVGIGAFVVLDERGFKLCFQLFNLFLQSFQLSNFCEILFNSDAVVLSEINFLSRSISFLCVC